MKGLNKGLPKTLKQLRGDGEALVREHADKVCFTEDSESVKQASELLFRTYNIAEKGHAIA